MRCYQVLAPVELSDDSKAAARLASALARRDHGTLTLLLVDQLPELGEHLASHAAADVFGSYLEDRVEALKQELEELAGTLGAGDVKTAVARDDVTTAILARAASDGADLVVLGAHRVSSDGGSLVIGNVAAAVAAHAPCPVLVARASTARPLGEGPFTRPLIVALLPDRARGAKGAPHEGRSLALARALSVPGARVEAVFFDDARGDATGDPDRVRDEFETAAARLRAEGVSASMLWSDGADVLTLLLERIERGRHDVVIVEKRAPLRALGAPGAPGVQPGLCAVGRKLLERAPAPVAVVTTG
jgi:nucleotide-binding universal stress UspA family protein